MRTVESGECFSLVIEPVHGLYLAALTTENNPGIGNRKKLVIYEASTAYVSHI